MTVYIAIIIFELLAFLLVSNTASKNSKGLLKVLMFVLFAVSAFRSTTVGGDLERYLPTFYETANCSFRNVFLGLDGWHEWGFSVYERLVSIISTTDRAFIIATSFLFIVISYKALKENSTNRILSLLLFTCLMYFGSFNIIRASISVSIGLCLAKSIEKRHFVQFCIGVLCASLIQKTSVALLPLYFLWNVKYSPKYIIILLGSSIILTFLLTGSGVVDFLSSYFQYQIKDEGEGEMWADKASGLTNMAIFLLISTLVLMRSYKGVRDKRMEFYIYIMAIATCLQCFSSVFILMNRLSLFYYSYLIFIVPYVIQKTSKKWFLEAFFLFAIIMLAVMGFVKDVHEIIPYKIF